MKNSNYFPLERNRYYYGKLLTVRDFEAEQNYFRSKLRLTNRVVHGAGVVCGLGVTISDDTTLMIESGMALDYLGREVVLEDPVIRKLQMIEGYDTLTNKTDAYLCLNYDETDAQPVNAVGAEVGASKQFNITRESYKLSLSCEAPEYRSLLEASGCENVNVLYEDNELTLVLYVPSAICAGEEFAASVLIVKNDKTPPVHFTLEGDGGFVESENGRILMEYHQSPEEKRNVLIVDFRLKAQNMSGVSGTLFPSGAELNLELGSHKYKNYVNIETSMNLCRDRSALKEHYRKYDGLAKHITGKDMPIYLAKLELIHSTGGVFLSSATDLPFGQTLQKDNAVHTGNSEKLDVTTNVRKLEYWQKPDVHASYSSETETMHFDFGIPSPEQYDYSITHGTVDIPMSSGIRVNAHYYSEEIPHGLGAGAVDVRLNIEFLDSNNESALLCGNREVFKSKNSGINPPWAETAVVLYPEKGTMRIGVWLHDTVDGNVLRVHYFAQRPERDTNRLLAERKVGISVTPDVSHLKKREQIRLKATVIGSENTKVNWRVKEENGGSIDANGIYTAPETRGTYEIIASSDAEPDTVVSVFVIVN